jgi:hypothetical protein
MPAKGTTSSPNLALTIGEEQYQRAVAGESGACLIADAIKAQYPHLSGVVVDMATIRVTDRKRGLRFTYLTPDDAQMVLLSFDQGWSNPTSELTIRRAVKVSKITRGRGKGGAADTAARRAARLSELEERTAAGEQLTRQERAALTRLRKPYTPVDRPTTSGPPRIASDGTVIDGRPLRQGEPHPNLLRSRHRHYGARMSKPGNKFEEAVEQVVAERLAQRSE